MNDILHQINMLWQDILTRPGASLAIVGNLVIIESLLSVDNAAVLATMVMDLPPQQRNKALKYGIWGAYIFRGLAMIFASVLIKIWWLKPVGGLYLLYLVFDWYKGKQTETKEDDFIDKKKNWLYKITVGSLGNFWATVCLVELMDMAFSIDNVFAAVAFTPNIILVCIGVFIGILAMRFIAQWFVKLMEKYAFLETAAFIVIGILGIKLVLSLYEHFYPGTPTSVFLGSHAADIGVSILTVAIFYPYHNELVIELAKENIKHNLIQAATRLFFSVLCVLLLSCHQHTDKNDEHLKSFVGSKADHAAKVIRIKDGDTFVLLINSKEQVVRLAHIDCPERKQPFADKAKQFASELCLGKYVKLIHNNQYDRDRRLIAELILPDGKNVNKEMVKNGLAWHFKKYSSDAMYAQLEMEARNTKTGLWSDLSSIAPWRWRKH